MQKNITIIIGTGREGRHSKKVALYVESLLKRISNAQVSLVDVRKYVQNPFTIPAWVEDSRTNAWKEIAKKSDAFVIVAPEYNHSYPGELKLLLDAAFKEYKNKPVGLVGVSSGGFGGVRVIEHLLPLVSAIGMMPVPTVVATSNVEELFRKEGDGPRDDSYEGFVQGMINEIIEQLDSEK